MCAAAVDAGCSPCLPAVQGLLEAEHVHGFGPGCWPVILEGWPTPFAVGTSRNLLKGLQPVDSTYTFANLLCRSDKTCIILNRALVQLQCENRGAYLAV